MASETLVLTHRPFYKSSLYNVQRTFHGRLVVCAKIVHPPANCWIYGLRDPLNHASAPLVEFHSLDLVFQRLTRLLAHRCKEVPSSLTKTAQHFHYSERQVSRIVLEYTGQNYAQLVLRLKMERAAALLKQKKTNAEHIASALGYANTSSFFRAFSKYYGFPPSKFSAENCGDR